MVIGHIGLHWLYRNLIYCLKSKIKMAAIIRIKRNLSEEPLDTVVLNCKKQKTDSCESGKEILTIFKHSITLDSKDEDILKHVKHSTKIKFEENYKTHCINIQNKIKLENQMTAKNNRYKVVNFHRCLGLTKMTEAENDANITIVDIVADENRENNSDTLRKSSYVYDVYCTDSDKLTTIDLNELISVYPLSDELVYGNARDNGFEDEERTDDSDSNEENNWRNDYPDESDVESISEEDMFDNMNRMDLNGDNELSSDDGQENLIYGIGNEASKFEKDIEPTDVDKYGKMYARFKARIKGDDNCETYDSESSNGYDDGYY